MRESQRTHDAEVCRLASKYARSQIWSSCPDIEKIVQLPKFTYQDIEYEPDIYLNQVPPEGDKKAVDWVFEVETNDSVSLPDTEKQLRAFAEYAGKDASKVIVLVPKEAVEEMKENLTKWNLTDIVAVVEWGWPDTKR